MNPSKFKTHTTLALVAMTTSLATADFVVDSFETLPLLSPAAVNPPYTNVSQSTIAGVTHGTYSMQVDFTNASWSWMYTADAAGNNWRDAATYAKWRRHNKLKIDLYRPALDFGWNLEVLAAMNGPVGLGWQQLQLVSWVWLNNGVSSAETLVWDYSAIRDAAPASGTWWQLALLARGDIGGTVYFDNVRFTDPLPAVDMGFTFPTNSSGGDLQGWARNWGSALGAAYWDATDANTNPASGSMNCFCDFTNTPSGSNVYQNVAYQVWNFGLDPTEYKKLVFDIKVDLDHPPISLPTYTGDYGAVQVVLRGTDITYASMATFAIPGDATNGLIHYELPLYHPEPTNLVGMNLIFQTTNAQGAISYYVDNIMFIADTNRPTLTMDKALPGLELNAAAREADQRQGIRTATGNYNWTAASGAVTYSMTINEGLPAQAAGMMAYMFLVGTTNANPGAAGDWDETDGIFLEITEQTDGLCRAALLYKTNAPASNGIRYATNGTLAVVSNVPMVGTWSLTLNQANFGLSTPGGGSTNATLPTGVVGQFSTNVFAYFGVQPNQVANLGRYLDLSRVQITGVSPAVDQVFTGQSSLNTNVLVVSAANAAGVQMRPTNIVYRFSWEAPSSGFVLWSASSLAGTWSDTGQSAIAAGPRNVLFLPGPALPSAEAGFFQLQKP